MKKIGITGDSGFIGKHLYNTLGLYPTDFERVAFDKVFFTNQDLLDSFVNKCDVIVHLAGMNRHDDPEVIYNTNILLCNNLIESLKRTKSKAHIIFSSSLQEEKDNAYGKSKKEGRLLLSTWANENDGFFTGLVIPNVFGPFGNPYYNSVIATFSHQLNNGEVPNIQVDAELKLIYVGDLVNKIIQIINEKEYAFTYPVDHTNTITVSEIANLLVNYKNNYTDNAIIPQLNSRFEINLFNTFRSYLDIKKIYPGKYTKHTDDRGSFTEIIRINSGGQISFSITVASITRGNHFHTRKIERFAVIKGEALIELRRIGTNEILKFNLSGNEPAYVDMPVWYTHCITNIGKDELYTIFWINEFYNSEDADTFFENV